MSSEEKSIPKHVALIPDGNRRWATNKGLEPTDGHVEGAKRASELGRHAREVGIHTLTFWGLSTENMTGRSPKELAFLNNLIYGWVEDLAGDIAKENVRFVHLGRKDRLTAALLDRLNSLELSSAGNTGHVFNLALDYGGRDEILRGVEKARGITKEEPLTEEEFSVLIDTGRQPYPNPDLVIRTGGDYRISGFMLWQSQYAELYFEKSFMPDFTVEKFDAALAEYATRQRRFGK